jgi:1,4-alpha-glucan branching enzyme
MILLKRFIGLFVTAAFLASSLITYAQVVTTDPPFPNLEQPVTVIFDATQGTGGLKDYSGDVYAHTGVITDESIQPSDWKYVKTNWGVNTPETKLTRVDDDLYELYIDDIRAYYGVPAGVEILRLAFVFRSGVRTGDRFLEGKDDGGADIFVDIFGKPVNVVFSKPTVSLLNPKFTELGSELEIEIIANALNHPLGAIVLYEDENEVARITDSDTLQYLAIIDKMGRTHFTAIAADTTGTADTARVFIVVNPDIVDEALPAGIIEGINYYDADDTRVTLALYAPFKEFIYVIGDFNDWEVDPDYFMKRAYHREDSVHFWITIGNLEPDTEYAFQYLIDGDIRVADPYTRKVLDPGHDAEIIQKDIYPDLMPYPHGKTLHLVSILHPGREEYQWQVTDFEPPAVEDLVIYELLVRDFLEDHTYRALIDTLDYLERLGVNAVELMPINQFEGNLSWGYNPALFFAPDKFYGTSRDLKKFIDECHKRGIAVILDMVFNHTFSQSPMLRMYFDPVNNRPAPENPWYMNHIFQNPAMNFGYKLDHGSWAFRTFMDRVNEYWMTEYKIDGFRFDLTKGFTRQFKGSNDYWGSLYDQDRVDNLKRMADRIWEVNPKAFVILEHLADNIEERPLANYGMLMWGNLNHNYNEATMGWHEQNKSNFSWISYKQRGWDFPHVVGYMESHDEQRLMWKNLQYGNSSGDYNIQELPTALNRLKLAGAFFFTIPGPKMIWQFGELGYDYGLGEEGRGRTSPMPIPWNDYLNDENRINLYKTWSHLIDLKKEYDVFRTDNFTLQVAGSVKRIYLNHGDMDVGIIGNFDVVERNVTLNLQHTGMWYDYFTGDTIDYTGPDSLFTLAPGAFYLLTSEWIEGPDEDIITHSGYRDDSMPGSFALRQNYPNPFNPGTTIVYSIPKALHVSLHIYDVLGRRIATIVDEFQNAGAYERYFDASHLSSGLYFYRIEAGEFVEVKRMMYVR